MEAGSIPPPVPVNVVNQHSSTNTGSKNASVSPTVFIISAVVAIAIISILLIHRLIRYFCHQRHGSSYRLPIYRTSSNGNTANAPTLSEHEKLKLIESLPIITLNSSMAKLRKSSHECAVCCEPFLPDAELRLLPACCHAFHKLCVDEWLKSNPSCPLCRSSITPPYPALPDLSSESFRLELGVSFRRSEPNSQIQNQIRPSPPPIRTYSLESHDYHIEEEVEIVQLRVTKSLEKRDSEISDLAPTPASPPPPLSPPSHPPPPSSAPPPPPMEILSREEPTRGWLQEYLDRLTSASSSFNSMRFPSQRWSERWSGRWSGRWSQRSSQRFDSGGGGAVPPDTWLWDLEAGQHEEVGGVVAVYRWLTGL